MRMVLFRLFIATIIFTYHTIAIADDNGVANNQKTSSYTMCYETNIRMIQDQVMKTDPAKAEKIVQDFCACVSPYIDEGYATKFKSIFSCIAEKSPNQKLSLNNIDPALKAACEQQAEQAFSQIADTMLRNCKSSQDELTKIFDTTKPCGGVGSCNNLLQQLRQ